MLIDASGLGLISVEYDWPLNQRNWCSIKYTMAVWKARNAY